MSISTLRAAAALLLGLLGALTLAGSAVPYGPTATKGVGALLLVVAAPELFSGRVANKPLALLGLGVGAFAILNVASLAWTVDAAATSVRARHVVMEALCVAAVAAVWRARSSEALGLGGALAAGVLAMGFLWELMAPEGARLRPFGVHPNLAARDAVLGALLGTLLIPRMPTWGAMLIGGVGGLALGVSFSSGAMLAAIAACAVLVLDPRWRPVAASLLAGTLLGGALLTVSAPPKLRTPATAVRGSAVEEIGSGRLVLWGHALRVAAAHPVLGAGAGAFPAAMEPIRVEHQLAGGEHTKPRRRAHSSFLEVLAETGPLGLLLFVLPLGWAGRRAWVHRDAVSGALVAFVAVSASTDSLLQQRSLWLGIAVAVLSAGAARPASGSRSPRPTT